jgi:hypothetical protein
MFGGLSVVIDDGGGVLAQRGMRGSCESTLIGNTGTVFS